MNALPPISQLLPHSHPMVLLDEVVEADEERLVARVTLRADSLFVEGDRIPALVAIEYMAQAIAAYAGLRSRAVGEPIRIGYLLGTRELTLDVDAFEVGDVLTIEAAQVWADDQLGSFRCAVLREARVVAGALVSVYHGKEVPPS